MNKILCEKCQKAEATILRLQVRNGDKKEINLCDDCAERNEENGNQSQ